jgi:intracellular sulfur oxidation DsrE/DsrF family protein
MTNLLADESILVVRLALVVNGGAISILIKDSDSKDAITHLINQNAQVYACKNAMKSNGITENDLIIGVVSVPSGVGQLAMLQIEHFAYIRP